MKEFWRENSGIVGKTLLNQFGAAFLGIMIVTAASAVQSQKSWLMLFASCFATFFYLFLIYNLMWERGGHDRIKADSGRAARKPLTGLWISLIANIPNFILAIVVIVSNPFKGTQAWAGTMNVIGRAACLLWEGMYSGIVAYFAPHNPIIHLLVIFPALFISTFAYLIGLSNKRIISVFELNHPKK